MENPRTLWRRDSTDPVLRYTVQKPEGTPAGAVLLVHGYADHMKRFDRVAQAWLAKGLSVARFDLRGHGTSEGRRGHVESFREYLRDVDEMLRELERDDGWKASGPPVLFGHSLGGLIALHAAVEFEPWVRGLAMTSPFFGLSLAVPLWKRKLGSLTSSLVPTLSLPSGLSGADVTRDERASRDYDADPLVFPNATARWFAETSRVQAESFKVARRVRVPAACLLAGADRVASTPTSQRVLAGVKDCRLQVVDGAYHEILNDPGWERWADWLADEMLRMTKR